MESSTFQPLLDWLVQNPNLSGVVIFAIAAIESLVVIGILVPGVAFMLGIGTLVGLDVLPMWSTLVWAAAGAIFGDGLGYWLGWHYDKQLRNLWPLTRYPDLIPLGEKFFRRHGGKSILFGRFVGPVRSVIPVVAGMMHMSPGYFYLVNVISAIAWAPVVILPGVAFGASLNQASEVALRFAALLVLLFFLVWFGAWLLRKLFGKMLAKIVRRAWLIFNTVFRRRPLPVVIGLTTVLIVLITLGSVAMFGQARTESYPLSDDDWWETGWQALPAYRNSNLQTEPFSIQWRGDIDVIKKYLIAGGWVEPEVLTLKNAMRWLTPTPQLAELPLWRQSFNQRDAALLMIKTMPELSGIIVLRLWSVSTVDKGGQGSHRRYWVATVSSIDVVELIAGFHIPQAHYFADLADGDVQQILAVEGSGAALPPFEYRTMQRKIPDPRAGTRETAEVLLIKINEK